MRNRLLSSNGRPGEALRSCQDAGAGGAGIADVWDSAKDPATEVSSRPFSYWAWGFTAMAVNRAVSSHAGRVGLALTQRSYVWAKSPCWQKWMRLATPPVCTSPALRRGCNIGEMPRKVQVKCAIAGRNRRLRMTLAQREELRRVGRENNATVGLVCPVHVKAAFNFEFDDIDVDVPLGELLVEASKDTPPLARDADAAAGSGGRAGEPVHARMGRQDYLVHLLPGP